MSTKKGHKFNLYPFFISAKFFTNRVLILNNFWVFLNERARRRVGERENVKVEKCTQNLTSFSPSHQVSFSPSLIIYRFEAMLRYTVTLNIFSTLLLLSHILVLHPSF